MATASHLVKAANRINAQQSTGPKTPEGKLASSKNALKHGQTAKKHYGAQRTPEVEEERVRWIGVLNPQNDIALALAEASFDCKVRFNLVSKADDAAIALRAIQARKDFDDVELKRVDELWKKYRANPEKHYKLHLTSVEGSNEMKYVIERLSAAIKADLWNPSENQELLRVEGADRFVPDPELEMFVKRFDMRRKLITTIESAKISGSDTSELIEGARFALRMQEADYKAAKTNIQQRIDRIAAKVGEANRVAKDERDQMRALTIAAASFDPTPEGINRRRYLRESWRDFSKSTEDALAAAGPPPEPAPAAPDLDPTVEPEVQPASETVTQSQVNVSRNEADPDCSESDDSPAIRLFPTVVDQPEPPPEQV